MAAAKPVSLLLDPKLSIDDIKIALKHSSLEIEPTSFPQLFIVKPTAGDSGRKPVLRTDG